MTLIRVSCLFFLYLPFATSPDALRAFLFHFELIGLITTWYTALSSLSNQPNTLVKLLIGSSSRYLKVLIGNTLSCSFPREAARIL